MVTIKLEESNQWVCVPAEPLPDVRELDDEIKRVLHRWHEAARRITIEDIRASGCVPLVLPKLDAIDPIRLPGISKFNRQKWESEGGVHLSRAGWVRIFEAVAKKLADAEQLLTLRRVRRLPFEMDAEQLLTEVFSRSWEVSDSFCGPIAQLLVKYLFYHRQC